MGVGPNRADIAAASVTQTVTAITLVSSKKPDSNHQMRSSVTVSMALPIYISLFINTDQHTVFQETIKLQVFHTRRQQVNLFHQLQ